MDTPYCWPSRGAGWPSVRLDGLLLWSSRFILMFLSPCCAIFPTWPRLFAYKYAASLAVKTPPLHQGIVGTWTCLSWRPLENIFKLEHGIKQEYAKETLRKSYCSNWNVLLKLHCVISGWRYQRFLFFKETATNCLIQNHQTDESLENFIRQIAALFARQERSPGWVGWVAGRGIICFFQTLVLITLYISY